MGSNDLLYSRYQSALREERREAGREMERGHGVSNDTGNLTRGSTLLEIYGNFSLP